MTEKIQAQEYPLEKNIQRFLKLLPQNEPEDIRQYKKNEMARLIGLLHKRRRHKVDFHGLWISLLWIPQMKSRFKSRRQRISEFKDRLGKTTKISAWARNRNRIRRNLPPLLKKVEELFQEAYSDPWISRTLISLNYGEGEIFEKRDKYVLLLSKKMRRALLDSPLFLAKPYPRPAGHQPEPWLQKAKAKFKKAGVPQSVGSELLRLINVKPLHTL